MKAQIDKAIYQNILYELAGEFAGVLSTVAFIDGYSARCVQDQQHSAGP
jgi:hypothetical protein